MPTRIVLQESTPPSRMAASSHNHNNNNSALPADEEYAIRQTSADIIGGVVDSADVHLGLGPFQTPPRQRPRLQDTTTPRSNNSSHRKVVGFRSSILRGTNTNNNFGDDSDIIMGRRMRGSNNNAGSEDEAAKQRRLELNLSNEDIRASPRLLGYLFGSIGTDDIYIYIYRLYCALVAAPGKAS